jgi:superoxide dismutase
MELHHSKHHATYVAGLNTAEESLANLQAKGDVKGYIKLGNALKFNGGGHMYVAAMLYLSESKAEEQATTLCSGKTWHLPAQSRPASTRRLSLPRKSTKTLGLWKT